jgi:hypothetical protein
VTSIEFGAFYGTGIKSITIPEGVISIRAMAFGFCRNLKSITIPNGLTSIERNAFSGSYGIKSITILNPIPPEITKETFAVNKSSCVLNVPAGSEKAYRSAKVWKSFKNIRVVQ